MFACIYSPYVNEELADFAYAFSPVVEHTKQNTVTIDVAGCELMFGSPYGLATEVATRANRPRAEGGLGSQVNIAIAGNPDTAIHAALHLPGISFVAEGEELTCLREFPIESLEYSLVNIEAKQAEVILETLKLWGVQTFGAFAELPVTGVSERLGQEGVHLQALAAGKTRRHLKSKQPAPIFSNAIELDHPITELEPLSFIYARLLNQLCATLSSYALATNELLVVMTLENKSVHQRKLSLPHPLLDHKVFLKLLLLDTEMHPPPTGVVGLTISCEPVKPRVIQNGLFVPLAPAPDKLELTLARLAKLVGESNIGSPSLLDTHRPDAFVMKRFVLPTKADTRRRRKTPNSRQIPATAQQRRVGFRMFRPPLRAVVQAERGWPAQISAWGKQRSVYGKVVQLAGPWRTTGDWWRTDRWARDEWDVALETASKNQSSEIQGLYRIYRELMSGVWFVEGNYD
jgi:protein ImuB